MSAPANLRERSSGAEEQPRGGGGGGARRRGGRAPLRHQLEVGARLRARELQRGTRQLPARGKAAAGQPMRVGRAGGRWRGGGGGALGQPGGRVRDEGGADAIEYAGATLLRRHRLWQASKSGETEQAGRDRDRAGRRRGTAKKWQKMRPVYLGIGPLVLLVPLEPGQRWSRGDAKGLPFVPPAPRSGTSACERCRRH